MSDSDVDEKIEENVEKQITLIIDDREQNIIKKIDDILERNKLKINYKVERINVGDFVICYGNKVFAVFERKTIDDYSDSLKDGRSKNKEKLIEMRKESECDIFYIIENEIIFHPSREKIRGIKFKSIKNSIIHLLARDKIGVYWTKNHVDTIKSLCEFVYTYEKIIPLAEITGGDEKKLLKTITITTDENVLIKIWSKLPAVSEKTAELLINGGFSIYNSWVGLTEEQENKLINLKYPDTNRRINDRAVKYIKKIKPKRRIMILGAMTGISAKTAKIIMDNNGYKILCGKTVDEYIENLSKIKITDKYYLSTNKIKKIYHLFHYTKIN